MSTMSASPAELGAAPAPASRRVIDAPTRMVHWLMALSFTGAYLSAESERWHLVHITLGYTLLGLVAWRLLWGLLGPRRSRLSALFARLRSLPAQLRAWRQGRGHPLAAQQLLNAAAMLGLLGTGLAVGLSGLAVELEWLGGGLEDALSELHEAGGEFMLMLVLGHLALIALASLLKRQNAALPMITGRMPGRGADLVRRNMGWLAGLLLAAVLGFWAWQWQGAPAGGAGSDGPAAVGREHHRGHDRDDD